MTNDPNADLDVIVIGGGQAGPATAYYLRRAGLRYEVLDAGEKPGGALKPRMGFAPALFAQWLEFASMLADASQAWRRLSHARRRHRISERLRATVSVAVERPVKACRQCDRWGPGGRHRPWAAQVENGRQRHRDVEPSPHPRVSRADAVRGPADPLGAVSFARSVHRLTGPSRRGWKLRRPDHGLRFSGGRCDLGDDHRAAVPARRCGRSRPVPTRHRPLESATGGSRRRSSDWRSWRHRRHSRRAGRAGTRRPQSRRPFTAMHALGVTWFDGATETIDAIIWCTDFRPALDHLAVLSVVEADGRVAAEGKRSIQQPTSLAHRLRRLEGCGVGDHRGSYPHRQRDAYPAGYSSAVGGSYIGDAELGASKATVRKRLLFHP
jgi:putative flavoprotein involved in K+ transport